MYLDSAKREKETVSKSIKIKHQKHKSGNMVDKLNTETKVTESVLGNKWKFQLLGRPVGLVYLSTNYPKQNCTFESNYFWRGKKKI